mmetsp:Transcript_123424/g.345557  ORF Transcript_123424/g.345557 Transcript_123424/m.345557 type:complete len:290 (-) Transcript_123424:7-876(-)
MGIRLHELLVLRHRLDLRLVDIHLGLAEVLEELLERGDDAVGVEIVVLHLHLVGGLLQQHHGLAGGREAKRVGQDHGGAEGAGDAGELREARGGLRCLQRLQSAGQRIEGGLQVRRVGVVRLLRRRALRIRSRLLLLVLGDGVLGVLDVLVVGVALRSQLLDGRGQGSLVVLALLDRLHLILRGVLAEAGELLVGLGLGLALGKDLGLDALEHLNDLLHGGGLLLPRHHGLLLRLGGLLLLLPLGEIRPGLGTGGYNAEEEGGNREARHLSPKSEAERYFAGWRGRRLA